jgi:hypothetical protein
MIDDTILPFWFPAVQAKKVTAAFDGGRLTSNGGVMLLAMAERRLGLARNPNFLALNHKIWPPPSIKCAAPQAVVSRRSLACGAGTCMALAYLPRRFVRRCHQVFELSLKNTSVRIGANGDAARHHSTASFQ